MREVASSVQSDRDLVIRFSHDVFGAQRVGGVSRYVVELHQAMLRRGMDSRILAGFHQNEYLPGCPRVVGKLVRRGRVRRIMRQGNELLNQLLGGGSGTVFHRSFHGALRHPRCRLRATTVYDMIPELFPDPNDPNPASSRAKRMDCEEADLVCAISETTCQDLLRLWSIPPERVVVTHLGVSRLTPSNREWLRDFGPYVVHVGRRGSYKNFLSLLPAIARTMRGTQVRFLCFGGGPPVAEETRRIRELGIEKIVHFVGGSDADLAACYQQAIGHVTASLYEGFGLTPIEAMLYGCPVSCTNRGSLPEVVGAAAHIFDPDSDGAMDDAIRWLLEGKTAHDKMIARGFDRAALFDWDRTAEHTLDAYAQTIAQQNL